MSSLACKKGRKIYKEVTEKERNLPRWSFVIIAKEICHLSDVRKVPKMNEANSTQARG